jgi:hypothetical protein
MFRLRYSRTLLLTSSLALILIGLMLNVADVNSQNGSANPVVLENLQTGTTDWQPPGFDQFLQQQIAQHQAARLADDPSDSAINRPQNTWVDDRLIEGYASAESVNAGQPIHLHISAKAQVTAVDLRIYRMGWYGGSGAHFLRQVSNVPVAQRPIPAPHPVTGRIEANWPVSHTLNTDPTWLSGVYLVYMYPAGQASPTTYIIFVLRNDGRPADILYQVAFTTYQAYNNWGGKSLYDYNSTSGAAVEVSYDRPYSSAFGAGLFFTGDYNMIRWLESQGYNVKYAASGDVEANQTLMQNSKVFLSNYHDEYYSWRMFDHVEIWRNQGKHLAWFTSNNIYWQIRYAPSTSGVANRVIVCYKSATDPMNTSASPWLTTVRFRSPPVNRPENQLLGVQTHTAMPFGASFDWVVTNANHWVYEGTGLTNGSVIPQLVGYEYDRIFDNGLTPNNLVVLSHSPAPAPYGTYANGIIYTASSGALVFSAATNYWAYLLDGNPPWARDARVQRMTTNLLNRMINTIITPTPTPTPTATPTIPPGTPFIANGSFTALQPNGAPTAWQLYGVPTISALQWSVQNGVFNFHRALGSSQAVVYQNTGVAIAAQRGIEADFQLGNTSSVRKRVLVLIHDGDFSDSSACTFWLPANTPLRTYQMKLHTTEPWTNTTISFYAPNPADGLPALQLDNVSLREGIGAEFKGTLCTDPSVPAPPGGADSSNLLDNADFSQPLNPTVPLNAWSFFNQINAQIVGGMAQMYRVGTPRGSLFQEDLAVTNTGMPLEVTLQMGNTENRRMRVVLLIHKRNFEDLSVCAFWLAPNTPLGTYTLRSAATINWTDGTAFSIYPDTLYTNPVPTGRVLIDNVTLRQRPGLTVAGTECYEPGQAVSTPSLLYAPVLTPTLSADMMPTMSRVGGEAPLLATPSLTPTLNSGESGWDEGMWEEAAGYETPQGSQ